MKYSKATLLSLLAAGLLLTGQSCSSGLGGISLFPGQQKKPPPPPQGILKSFDQGRVWEEANALKDSSATLDTTGITALTMHPDDSRILYIRTGSGLYETRDGAKTWERISTEKRIKDFALDTKNNILYILTADRLLKSIDRGKSWPSFFFQAVLEKVAVNSAGVIFVGTSKGQILRSTDFGNSWENFSSVGGRIGKIMIHPDNDNEMLIPTLANGIFKSTDGGSTWNSIADSYKSFRGSLAYTALIRHPSDHATLLYASGAGLLKSTDNGATWELVPQITGNRSVITAVDLGKDNTLYITSVRTLFRTKNFGKTWESFNIPRANAQYLAVDHYDPNILYIGVLAPKK